MSNCLHAIYSYLRHTTIHNIEDNSTNEIMQPPTSKTMRIYYQKIMCISTSKVTCKDKCLCKCGGNSVYQNQIFII